MDLLENVEFITDQGKKIFFEIKDYIQRNNEINIEDLPTDKSLIEKINKFASIKHISNKIKKDHQKLLEIFDEMRKDLANLSIEIKISDLESKFSEDLNESTFNKIKELKKLQNIN